ncbi:MAG: hypothetical protein KF901_22835 [Myxococcales bacterium]|nr:hypothetical protein [Myxococcales bacterium]
MRIQGVVAGMLTSGLVVGLLAWGLTDAEAQRRGQRPQQQRQQREAPAPMSDAVAPALGGIEWGWNKRQLLDFYVAKLNKEYQPRLNKARDAMTEDQLRSERDRRIRTMRESFLQFDGQTTGYDSGFLRDEFTHGNQESMMRVRGDNGDDYFFFIRGQLWKWYHAFDASVFQGANFEQFQEALSGRFGEGRVRNGVLAEGERERTWMEWHDARTRVRAVDNTTFYGFYGLVFEDKQVLGRLSELRTNRQRRGRGSHSLVDAVTGGDGEATDSNTDIVDRITGNIRRRPENEGNKKR